MAEWRMWWVREEEEMGTIRRQRIRERERGSGGWVHVCVVYVARMDYPRRFGFKPPAVTAVIPGGLDLYRRR